MSRLNTTPFVSNAAAARLTMGRGASVEVDVDVSEVMATLGVLPSAMLGSLWFRNVDLLSHHRRAVIKNAQTTWPAGNSGFGGGKGPRKFVAALTRWYPGRIKNPTRLEQVAGEAFAFGEDARMATLEFGGKISSREPMLIPFAAVKGQTVSAARRKEVVAMLRRGVLNLNPKTGLLYADYAATRTMGARSVPVGVLRRSRVQRPILGFFRQFDLLWARHSPLYDQVIENALQGVEVAIKDMKLLSEKYDRRGPRGGRTDVRREVDRLVNRIVDGTRPGTASAARAAKLASKVAARVSLAGSLPPAPGEKGVLAL
ncbi:MAG: hypothetical protein K2Q20_06565 [Phycisphaerales bacterium]|nr:hypothetical protein [Phycisphaerales bacterium]